MKETAIKTLLSFARYSCRSGCTIESEHEESPCSALFLFFPRTWWKLGSKNSSKNKTTDYFRGHSCEQTWKTNFDSGFSDSKFDSGYSDSLNSLSNIPESKDIWVRGSYIYLFFIVVVFADFPSFESAQAGVIDLDFKLIGNINKTQNYWRAWGNVINKLFLSELTNVCAPDRLRINLLTKPFRILKKKKRKSRVQEQDKAPKRDWAQIFFSGHRSTRSARKTKHPGCERWFGQIVLANGQARWRICGQNVHCRNENGALFSYLVFWRMLSLQMTTKKLVFQITGSIFKKSLKFTTNENNWFEWSKNN